MVIDGKDLIVYSVDIKLTPCTCNDLLHTQTMKDLLSSVFRLQWVPVDQFKLHVYPGMEK